MPLTRMKHRRHHEGKRSAFQTGAKHLLNIASSNVSSPPVEERAESLLGEPTSRRRRPAKFIPLGTLAERCAAAFAREKQAPSALAPRRSRRMGVTLFEKNRAVLSRRRKPFHVWRDAGELGPRCGRRTFGRFFNSVHTASVKRRLTVGESMLKSAKPRS